MQCLEEVDVQARLIKLLECRQPNFCVSSARHNSWLLRWVGDLWVPCSKFNGKGTGYQSLTPLCSYGQNRPDWSILHCVGSNFPLFSCPFPSDPRVYRMILSLFSVVWRVTAGNLSSGKEWHDLFSRLHRDLYAQAQIWLVIKFQFKT